MGILLRSRWYQYLISCDDHPRHLSITLRLCGKEFSFTSCHLPDTHAPAKVFEDTLQSLADACSGCSHNVVGIDANAQVGLRTSVDCPTVLGICGRQPRDDRGEFFVRWLHSQGLKAISTFYDCGDDPWTSTNWGKGLRYNVTILCVTRF